VLFQRNKDSNGARILSARTVLVAAACGVFGVASLSVTASAQTAPKTAAQKAALRGGSWDSIKAMPDWSGMWTPGRPPAGTPAVGGSGPFATGAPWKPEVQARLTARMARVRGEAEGGQQDIPLSNSGFCIPGGVPGNMALVSHEYVFNPGRVVILLENSEVRRIWTDGRGHEPVEEATPSFQGDSIGHWEGDTLVVETTNIYPEAEFGFGNHVTDKTVVKERFTRVGNKMRVETAITDPTLLNGVWNYTRWYDREDRPFIEYVPCTMADRAVKQGDLLKGMDFNPNRDPLGAK